MKKITSTLTLAVAALSSPAMAQDFKKTELTVVGSWSNLSVYQNHEYPFWTKKLPELTDGKVTAKIKGMNEMGLKGPELLRLMSQGVVTFGGNTILYFAGDNPINEAIDISGIAPDVQTARAVTDAFASVYQKFYQEQSKIHVMGFGTYAAQVLYCNKPITGLADLKGLKVRTSGRGQAEFIEALGGTGVSLPFPEVVPALQNGVVDCGITGAHSGYSAKWYEVATHIYTLPLGWNQILYAVNQNAWNKLEAPLRDLISTQIGEMVENIWADADKETRLGIACNTGAPECTESVKGKMVRVDPSDADRALLAKITREVTIPQWAKRCSKQCVADFNATIGKVIGIDAPVK